MPRMSTTKTRVEFGGNRADCPGRRSPESGGMTAMICDPTVWPISASAKPGSRRPAPSSRRPQRTDRGVPRLPAGVEDLLGVPEHAGVVHGDGVALLTSAPSPFLSTPIASSVGASPDGIVMPGAPSASSTTAGRPAAAGWSCRWRAAGRPFTTSITKTRESSARDAELFGPPCGPKPSAGGRRACNA